MVKSWALDPNQLRSRSYFTIYLIVTGNTQSCPESSSSSESTSSLEQDPVASPARSPDTTTLDDARGKFATFYCVFEQVVNSLAAG